MGHLAALLCAGNVVRVDTAHDSTRQNGVNDNDT